MVEKRYVNIAMQKEKLDESKEVYVVQCTNLGVASQGESAEEAMKMIKEAVELYLEERPDAFEELGVINELRLFSVIEVEKPGENQ